MQSYRTWFEFGRDLQSALEIARKIPAAGITEIDLKRCPLPNTLNGMSGKGNQARKSPTEKQAHDQRKFYEAAGLDDILSSSTGWVMT